MARVYISYGFAEGPKISMPLVDALRSVGFLTTRDRTKADIIIAHSMGCFTLPADTKAKTVLLAGPSNGFVSDSPARTQLQKVRRDFARALIQKRRRAWLNKSFWNFVYFMTLLNQLPAIVRGARIVQHTLPSINADNVVVIVYRDDPWASQLSKTLAKRHPAYTFISHTGVHDDLWTNPEEYVAVLQYLHET